MTIMTIYDDQPSVGGIFWASLGVIYLLQPAVADINVGPALLGGNYVPFRRNLFDLLLKPSRLEVFAFKNDARLQHMAVSCCALDKAGPGAAL